MYGTVGLIDRIDKRSGTQGPYAGVTVSLEGGEERRVFFAATDEPEEEDLPCLMEFIERGVVRQGTRLLFHHRPDQNEWFRWRGYRDRYGLWKKGPGVSVNVDRLVPVYQAIPYCRLKGFITGRLGIEEVTSERSIMGIVRHRILQRHWRLLWGELSAGRGTGPAMERAREGTQDFIQVLAEELKLPDIASEAASTLSTCEEVSEEIIDWMGGRGYFCSEYNLLSNRFGLIGRTDFVGVRRAARKEGRIIEYKITDNFASFESRKSWGSARALLQAGIYSMMCEEAMRLPGVSAEVWVFDKWSGSKAHAYQCDDFELEEHLRRSMWARDEYLFSVTSPRPSLGEYGKSRCSSCSFARVCKRLSDYEPDPSLSEIRDALDLESEANWRNLQPVDQLFEDGLVLPRTDIVEYDQDRLKVRVGEDVSVNPHPGSFVRFSPLQSTHGWGFGVVKGMDGREMEIRLRDPLTPTVLAEGRLRLDFSIPVDFSGRAKMAITAIEMPDLLTEEEEMRSHLESLKLAVESASALGGEEAECELGDLNDSQRDAARAMLGSKLTVVHGPFGSGKTTVIARAALEMVKAGRRVLVSSYTNNAVDNAMEMIRERANREGVDLDQVRVATADRSEAVPGIEVVDPRNYGREDIVLLKDAQVVGSTLISCLSDAFQEAFMDRGGYVKLRDLPFDLCIVDEASQCVLPFALIPCLFSRRWVLVGDHRQLEPLVLDSRAANSLSSWFDMAVKDLEGSGRIVMLDVQYRCPHEVGSYLSDQFYDSKLKNDEGGNHEHPPIELDAAAVSREVNAKLSKAGIEARFKPEDAKAVADPNNHLVFIDTCGKSRERGRRSKSNTGEAIIASEILEILRRATEDLIFLSPYHAQNRLMKELVRGDVIMGTVDSYQGRQADVVVLSLVRSNTNGLLGFLRNVRRLNVAMSRCMKKLIVISDSSTIRMNRADLQARDALMNYIAFSRKLGTYLALAPPKRRSPNGIERRQLAIKPSLRRRDLEEEE